MQRTILVVEDNPDVRDNLEETLELSGYRVRGAGDGAEGIRLARQIIPDLILCDVMMPNLDGFGVLQILRRDESTAGIPFIFLTAKTEKRDFRRGMELGADDYLTKPFGKDELLLAIETRLSKHDHLRDTAVAAPAAPDWGRFANPERGRAALLDLAERHDFQTFERREHIETEGSQPRYLYHVEGGQVKLTQCDEYGREFILDLRGPGEWVGFRPLMGQHAYDFGVAALDRRVRLRAIPAEDFLEVLYADRHVASYLFQLTNEELSERERQLVRQAYHSVRKRTAEALVELYDRNPDADAIEILREDLANRVGTATESVIRMVREFKREKLVNVVDGDIVVLDRDRLDGLVG